MLITQLKAKETIVSLAAGKKVFIINCHGCKEVRFPEKEAVELQKELSAEGNVTGIMTTDYICNPENMYRPSQNIWKTRWYAQPAIHTRYLVSRV